MILHYKASGNGEKTVVFLHGMASSGRYWQAIMASPPVNTRFIAIDLLGFGASPMPKNSKYTYGEHVDSIWETLESADITQPVTLVAHSMGALLALHLAAKHPKRVKKLILCGLPYYPNETTARKDITQSKKLWELAYYGPTSNALCIVWCKWLRPISKHIAPLYLKRLPKEVAEDSLLHTWRSYSQSLENIIEKQSIRTDLEKVCAPMHFLYGSSDTCGQYLQESDVLKSFPNAKLRVYPELTHQLPLERPDLIIEAL
jgi:pimeloyl-ACP methyl ester carboxylesterase